MDSPNKQNQEVNIKLSKHDIINNQHNSIKKLTRSKISTICVFIIAALCIIQDFVTQDIFYEKSENIQIELQKNETDSWINFNHFASLFCIILIAIFLIKFLFTNQRRLRVLSLLAYLIFIVSLMSTLKLLYAQPRPYMTNSQIKAHECSIEFGNPSGHAFINFSLYFLTLYCLDNYFLNFVSKKSLPRNQEFNQKCMQKQQQQQKEQEIDDNKEWKKKRISRVLILIFTILWLLMIGLSRVILGVHSLNQIMLGFYYGILFTAFYVAWGENILVNLIAKCSLVQKYGPKWWKYFIVNTVILLLYSGAIISIYAIRQNWLENFEQQSDIEMYKENIFKQCPVFKEESQVIFEYKFLANKCFLDTGLVSGLFALFYGFLFMQRTQQQQDIQNQDLQKLQSDQFYFKQVENYNAQLFLKNYALLSKKAKFQRVLSDILCLLVGIGPFFVVSKIILKNTAINIYLRYFLQYYIGAFLGIFIFIYATPRIFNYFKIKVQGDFFEFQIIQQQQIKYQLQKENSSSPQSSVI